MGTSLKLLPCGGPTGREDFSHEVLQVEWAEGLFEKIQVLDALPVPVGFNSFAAEGPEGYVYGNTQEDAYGEPLLMTTAKLLKTCGIFGPQGAYVAACRDDQLFALFWH